MYESGRTCPATLESELILNLPNYWQNDFGQERIRENSSNLRLLQIETSRLNSSAYEKQEPGFGLPGGAACFD